MLTEKQKELITATVPVLRENGVALTTYFYNRMFTHNPELKNMFNMGNQQNGKQQTALALSVLAYAGNISDPSVLLPAVNKIGHKHASLDIRPEQYVIVGKHLLGSISEVLGEGATPELLDAWAAAYGQLASLMTGVEAEIYAEAVAKDGGWTGWRPFIVKHKITESEEITSFHLYPSDGGRVAKFLPGQYVSVRLFLPELGLYQPRQYSLSTMPNENYYRISVKKESGANLLPDGMISNRLHEIIQEGDMIELAPPAGVFTLDTTKESPVIFVSGGVGQTPLMSMLEYLTKTGSTREIVWIHGSRNKAVHAFGEPVSDLAEKHENVSAHVFYDLPESDLEEESYFEGFVDLHKLKGLDLANADIYVCGPVRFLKKQLNDLVAMGVKKENIHYEEFGPAVMALGGE
jgi:nitric oxide dioxygenase